MAAVTVKGLVVRFDATSATDALDAALGTAYRMLVETGERRGFAEDLRPADYHASSQRTLIAAGHASLWMARHDDRDLQREAELPELSGWSSV